MFRTVINSVIRNSVAIRNVPLNCQLHMRLAPRCVGLLNSVPLQARTFAVFDRPTCSLIGIKPIQLLHAEQTPYQHHSSRNVTKFSLKKGKRKTVKAVVRRFKRLDWGGWIRTHCGRNKKMWKKSGQLKRRLRQHVFVNATQSWLLDKMVTKFWRRPKNYVDDPYEPYHSREEFYATAKKPIKS